ncbi:MAG: peptide chain release factor N(5)-glutamine methyltransferase [Thiotrichales bacterium]|nr:peptide chain release factor N(5)-glutamine methyltransferase [Thiotrichales bacterium]
MHRHTIGTLLRDSEQQLAHSDSPRLDAEILLTEVLEWDRARLYAHCDEPVPEQEQLRFTHLLNKRKNGEPIAYITGQREFWSMQLRVNRHTLIPRPETECLVEKILGSIDPAACLTIADLGTGTGAIALALAKERPECRIIATDIDDAALAIARYNIETQAVSNIKLLKSDWFESLHGYRFDIIISNPPYVRDADPHLQTGDVRFEPRLALAAGVDGLDKVRIIIERAPDYLIKGGRLFLEHGHDQGRDIVSLIQARHYAGIEVIRDLNGHHRGSMASWTH